MLSSIVIISQLAPATFGALPAAAATVEPQTALPPIVESKPRLTPRADSDKPLPETAHRVEVDNPILLNAEARSLLRRGRLQPRFASLKAVAQSPATAFN